MRNRNNTIVHDLSNFSSSDRVIRSVPFPNQCLGEAEEWQRSGEPHSSDPSVAFPWQRAEELHSGSSEQQCGTWTMYESCLDEQTQQTNLLLSCFTDLSLCYSLCVLCSSGVEEVTEYDPNLLSDPQWPCGRHKRVLIFASYVVSLLISLSVFTCS